MEKGDWDTIGQLSQLLRALLDCRPSDDFKAAVLSSCPGIQQPFIPLAGPILSFLLSQSPQPFPLALLSK